MPGLGKGKIRGGSHLNLGFTAYLTGEGDLNLEKSVFIFGFSETHYYIAVPYLFVTK